jgi:N-acetylglucosaminyldiphosphoundecaprenol N-acetyl-beta-D-mannosaminyltransferase
MMCPSGVDVPVKRVTVGGVGFDPLTEDRVVDHVRAALERGQGGRILTPNVDVLRQIGSSTEARAALDDSTLVVADGMPVIWASRLAGTPLPQRVSGADLIWSLARGLGADGRTIFILGGEPAVIAQTSKLHRTAEIQQTNKLRLPEQLRGRHTVNEYRSEPPGPGRRNAGPSHRAAGGRPPRNEPVPFQRAWVDGAENAANALLRRSPGLRVVGAISPPYGFDLDPAAVELILKEVVAAQPDLFFVGVGFPRQELLIAELRRDLPGSWFLGCGQAINFVAGEKRRAPAWMQRAGVEWLHRLLSEPRRLAERYLRHDLPFATALLARTAIARYRRPTAARHSR